MRRYQRSNKLLCFAKKLLWEPIKDKCTIFAGENARRYAFEVIFEAGVEDIFHNLRLKEKLELLPYFIGNVVQIWKSTKGLDRKPKRDLITPEELKEVEKYAKKLGVSSIGYCKVDRDDIFEGFGLVYGHAIVFTVEMDKKEIAKAPSFTTLKMIYKTYLKTGIIANKLAKLLREMGFGAHAGPGLGGLTIYPVLAEKAGLGTFGRSGLIITPECGPRHRIGIVYTNIRNLPKIKKDDFSWVKEFCARCGRCIRECPVKAIYEKPVITKNGYVAHINSIKCARYFVRHYSCGICIKVCPFNIVGYEKLKKSFIKRSGNASI
jgi:epoxyqueuosine reductase